MKTREFGCHIDIDENAVITTYNTYLCVRERICENMDKKTDYSLYVCLLLSHLCIIYDA